MLPWRGVASVVHHEPEYARSGLVAAVGPAWSTSVAEAQPAADRSRAWARWESRLPGGAPM